MHDLYATISDFVTVAMTVRFLASSMLALVIVSIGLTLMRRWRQPAELVTSLSIQKDLPRFQLIGLVSQALFLISMLATNLWLAEPVIPVSNETRTLETRDIFIAVDKSGSMDSRIVDNEGNLHDRKIDAAAQAVKFFVARRTGDRVGLSVFDDNTYMHWPMTDNLKIILKKADLIAQYSGGGTNFESPTGPIQTALDHWKEYGRAKTKVLIMVSDGEAPISDERMVELSKQMRTLGGKIYLIGIGETWTDPAKAGESQVQAIKKLVADLNGRIFAAADEKQMLDAVATIDALEKSDVKVEVVTTYRDVSFYFALVACLFLLLFFASVALTGERA
jgi:Ca-activated chloride channel homolog